MSTSDIVVGGHYEHRGIRCPHRTRTDDRALRKPKDCICGKRVWVNEPTEPTTRSGSITVMASTERPGKVEIIMSDGEDAAITYMSAERALAVARDLLTAAGKAKQ